MQNRFIDLYSDTKSKPSPAMRKAMADADVGDEQKYEDPTTNRLRDRICEILGKEDAVFMPSGTMCNQAAIRVHCRLGDEVIADRTAHIINAETGGTAANSGVMIRMLDGPNGVFTADQEVFLTRFLRLGDRVKFACFRPDLEEMARSFEEVLRFVEETVPRPAEPQPGIRRRRPGFDPCPIRPAFAGHHLAAPGLAAGAQQGQPPLELGQLVTSHDRLDFRAACHLPEQYHVRLFFATRF